MFSSVYEEEVLPASDRSFVVSASVETVMCNLWWPRIPPVHRVPGFTWTAQDTWLMKDMPTLWGLKTRDNCNGHGQESRIQKLWQVETRVENVWAWPRFIAGTILKINGQLRKCEWMTSTEWWQYANVNRHKNTRLCYITVWVICICMNMYLVQVYCNTGTPVRQKTYRIKGGGVLDLKFNIFYCFILF